MSSITQSERTLAITTPLGADVLLLLGFTGTESLSRLFSYQLELASTNDTIAAKDLVGKAVSWSISRLDQVPRHFSGIVSRFVAGAVNNRLLRTYRADIVPWPWLLTRTTDCRIFQNKNTPEIIESIFKDFGLSDFALELQGTFPKREYCVQYRETAFNFISRLMEHEGIFYFFRHENGKHTMVLANAISSYTECPESPVEYSTGSLAPNHIHSWEHHYEFRSGKWSRTDYNFETPSTNLLTTTKTVIDLPDAPKYEIFDYPGEYVVRAVGDPVTTVRMEEEEAGYNVVSAASQCCTFTPSGKFTLQNHDVGAENGEYMITSIRHSASELSYGSTTEGASYSNLFTCIPASVIYRPPRATPKPMVQGPQTAVVTGAPGEKIYCDKYGRVKVHFFWDRKGEKDDKSSCWIRVSQNWGGANWGGMFIPHVGQEVIVDFLEGDPDRPLITGRVYNAERMPPLALPANKTKSAIRDHGGNEIIMEGHDGVQQIAMYSPHSNTVMTMGAPASPPGWKATTDAFITFFAGKDWNVDIVGSHNENIKGNHNENIKGFEKKSVTLARQTFVGAIDHQTVVVGKVNEVGGWRAEIVGAKKTEFVRGKKSSTIVAGLTESVKANKSVTVQVNYTETVHGEKTETVDGKKTVTVGPLTEHVKGSQNTTVDSDLLETVKGKYNETVSGSFGMEAKDITINSTGAKLVLVCGGASLTLESGGKITMKGTDITVEGSGAVKVQGSKIDLN